MTQDILTFKKRLIAQLSEKLDGEIYLLPLDLGDLINKYIINITNDINWHSNSSFRWKMNEIQGDISRKYKLHIPVDYDTDRVIAYILYYFPINFPKIQYIVYDLIRYGKPYIFINREIKILDIGTGCGTIPISLSNMLRSIDGTDKLNVDVIESNKFFIEAFSQLVSIQNSNNYGIPIHVNNIIHGSFADETITKNITEKYDIITISNVLNETQLSIKELSDLIEKYRTKLIDKGHLIIIEPDDEERAAKITELKNLIKSKGIQVSSPCVDFWGVGNIKCDSWCTTRKFLEIPDDAKRFTLISNYLTSVNFSYLICDILRYKYSLPSGLTKLSELSPYCGVNVIGKVIERGEGPRTTSLFICDGTKKIPLVSYKYDISNNPKQCHKKIENLKINDIALFKNLFVNVYGGKIQLMVNDTTENPEIIEVV